MGIRVESDSSALRQQQAATRDAERETQNKITASRKQVEEARREADNEINKIQDQYTQQKLTVQERENKALENERTKAYEAALQVKRSQEAETSRIKRQAEKQQSDIKAYYDSNTQQIEAKGKEDQKRLERTQAQLKNYTTTTAQTEFELENRSHQARMQQVLEHHTDAYEKTKKETEAEYNRIKETSLASNQQATEKYNHDFKTITETQNQSLRNLNETANNKLNELRQSAGSKLAAYSSRSSDPFYQLKETQAQLTNEDNHFKLTAVIPEHEREHINVTVRGNHVVISGTRRNTEKLEVAPGQVRQTQAYQTFSESFPIDWPVDPKRMTQEWNGDQLVVRIAKRAIPEREAFVAKKPTPEKIQITRPDFPENLPMAKFAPPKKDDPAPSGGSPGSSTLS